MTKVLGARCVDLVHPFGITSTIIIDFYPQMLIEGDVPEHEFPVAVVNGTLGRMVEKGDCTISFCKSYTKTSELPGAIGPGAITEE